MNGKWQKHVTNKKKKKKKKKLEFTLSELTTRSP
jgi:hypothetical protein